MVDVEGVHRALNDVLVVVVASSGSWLGLDGGWLGLVSISNERDSNPIRID